MGAAAEHRGNRLIRDQLNAEQRDPIFQFMEDVNAQPKYPDAGYYPHPVTLSPGNGGWWAEPEGFKAPYGYWYPSVREAVRRWRMELVAYDAPSATWRALPILRTRP